MDNTGTICASLRRFLLGLIIMQLFLATPAFPLVNVGTATFFSGFKAFNDKDYPTAINILTKVMKETPDASLRAISLYWLGQAHLQAGHRQEATRYMEQFCHDYPDDILTKNVQIELTKLRGGDGKGNVTTEAENRAVEKNLPAVNQEEEKAAKTRRNAAENSAVDERIAVENTAKASRIAAEKAAAEKAAAEKAAAEKAAAEKAAAEKAAAEKAAAEKAAAEKAAAEKAAAEKAAAEKAAAEKAAAEKAAAEKAAAEKAAAEKAAAEKAAAEKAAAEKAAAEKVAAEKVAAEKVAAEKVAAEKAAAEKAAAEKAAAEKKAEGKVVPYNKEGVSKKAVKAGRKSARKEAGHKAAQKRAIAAYKAVVDQYPGSGAAARASGKLRELGISYPPGPGTQAAGQGENASTLTLEVGQVADFALTLSPVTKNCEVGKRFSVLFEVVNHGNGADSFNLESGFPGGFNIRFGAQSSPDVPITATPLLTPNEKFLGIVTGIIPLRSIDGQKFVFPIKVDSRFAGDVSQSREISLTVAAPLLRALIKQDKTGVLPGDMVTYQVVIVNNGAATASGTTVSLNYAPQYEPVDFIAAGFKQERKGTLVLDNLKIKPSESRSFSVAFQVKDDALANQELFLRTDLIDRELESRDSFLNQGPVVKGLSGVTVRPDSEKLMVIPGQIITIPVVVANTGNMREGFQIQTKAAPGITCRLFRDLNREGTHTTWEPEASVVRPLAPHEEEYLLLQVATPPNAVDGSDASATVTFKSDHSDTKTASVTVNLRFARPIVELSMTGKSGKLRPGEVSSYELIVTNRGSNIARGVELQSILPEYLEIVESDPLAQKLNADKHLWKFAELGAGERRTVKVTFRVKPKIPVGTSIPIKNSVIYQDQLGNRY